MHIIGGGGHAKVIIDNLQKANKEIKGVWDEDNRIISVLEQPIVGNLEAFKQSGYSPVIIGIGSNQIRKKIADQLNVEFGLAVHPDSVIALSAKLGGGTVVMGNATVNSDVVIGQHVIINTNASVDHDCVIGNYVHISPQAGLAGNVQIGEGTHVGMRAVIIQSIKVGKWATIGAGAVVIRDVPDYAVVVGNPGRIIKYNSH